MAILILAQLENDDWIKIVIAVLVFGGSALASVAKWLIGKFNPEEAKDKGAPAGLGVARPAQPVARPMTGQSTQERRPQRPAAQPRPVPGTPAGSASAGRPSLPSDGPPAVRPMPSRAPAKPRSPVPPRQTPRKSTGRTGRVGGGVAKHHLESEVAAHHLEDQLSERHIDGGVVKRHLQGLAAELDTEPAAAEERGKFFVIGCPTRQSLRRAVLMNEILGPPIALRKPDERF